MIRSRVPPEYTTTVMVKWDGKTGGIGLSKKHREYTIRFDTPKEFGGCDMYPCPNEYFLVGLGACIVNTFNFIGRAFKEYIEDLSLIIDCKTSLKSQSYEVEHIDINFKVKVSDEKMTKSVERLAKLALKTCHLVKLVSKSVDLNFNISIEAASPTT